MKVFVAGTPLDSMGWQRDLRRIRFRYRSRFMDADYLLEFMRTLEAEARREIERLTYPDPHQLDLFSCL